MSIEWFEFFDEESYMELYEQREPWPEWMTLEYLINLEDDNNVN